MDVTAVQTSNPAQSANAKSKKKIKINKIVTDDLHSDERTKEFQDLVRSLRAKAAYVAKAVRKQKKRSCKPIPITLCQQCGNIIVCQPRANQLKVYCGAACRQNAKRKRDRFKAARLLSRMHSDENPVQFWIVVHVISTDEPNATVYGARKK